MHERADRGTQMQINVQAHGMRPLRIGGRRAWRKKSTSAGVGVSCSLSALPTSRSQLVKGLRSVPIRHCVKGAREPQALWRRIWKSLVWSCGRELSPLMGAMPPAELPATAARDRRAARAAAEEERPLMLWASAIPPLAAGQPPITGQMRQAFQGLMPMAGARRRVSYSTLL